MFEVVNLCVKYPQEEIELLSGISFKLQKGEGLWLQGANGSGKTSLLYAISNIIPEEIIAERTGEVILDNQSLNDLKLNCLIPKLSIALTNPQWELFFSNPQDEIVFALENLGLKPPDIKDRIDMACARFSLGSLMKFNSHKMSEGFQKLLVLAVHAAINPQVLLLDEPLNGLSPAYQEKVIAWLSDYLTQGGCLVIADHNSIIQNLQLKILNLG